MKKTMKRVVASFVVIMVLATALISVIPASAAGTHGMTFSAGVTYTAEKEITQNPNTFEAVIMLPETVTDRGGVILGNFDNSYPTNFEIFSNGIPRIYVNDTQQPLDTDHNKYFTFDKVKVNTGKKLHLAIVRDTVNQKLHCYIDGSLKQTIDCTYTAPFNVGTLRLGGDFRDGNGQYFKGTIYSATMYSDVRTTAEIEADSIKTIVKANDGLIAHYDLTNVSDPNRIADKSGNGYNMIRNGLSFSADTKYQQSSTVSIPHTFEAQIKLTADDLLEDSAQKRGGVILGNYYTSTYSHPIINFEVVQGGKPRLYIKHNNLDAYARFDDINVADGALKHVAITVDSSAKKVYCYINGSETPTGTIDYTASGDGLANFETVWTSITSAGSTKFALGGDFRNNNVQYFKGEIYSAAMFSGVRSAADIAADMNAMPTGTNTGLIAWYNAPATNSTGTVNDASGNGNHMVYSNTSYSGNLGLSFKSDALYKPAKPITQKPKTFEATVFFPADTAKTSRPGVILGNYDKGNCVNFEVWGSNETSGGKPRLYIGRQEYIFGKNDPSIDLYTGKPEHIAIVIDQNKVYCYINGTKLEGEGKEFDLVSDNYDASDVVLGGDIRGGNSAYFKNNLLSLAIFSDARTATEIANDMTATAAPTDADLIAWYDMTTLDSATTVKDDSPNGYDMVRKSNWIASLDDEKVLGQDYAYSFAVIGDTQIIARDEVDGKYSGYFAKIYDYIIDNKQSKNIQFVMGLGDITDTSTWYDDQTDIPAEWNLAMTNIQLMDGVVPYSLVRGNHDATHHFTDYVKWNHYKDVVDGAYENNMLNTYQELIVGDVKYLIFALDYGPSDAVLAWAGNIIGQHPDHNVIITTHSYLYHDGTNVDKTCPPATTGGSNNGDGMWDKMIKDHENIVLVLSGHDPWDTIVTTQTTGVNGNTVTQMLIDPQGIDLNTPTGMVAMFYFSEDGRSLDVEWYSTIQEKYYRSENQFSIKIDTAGSDTTELESAVATVGGLNADDYSEETWSAVQTALAKVNNLAGSKNQIEIDAAVKELNDAIAALAAPAPGDPNGGAGGGSNEDNDENDDSNDNNSGNGGSSSDNNSNTGNNDSNTGNTGSTNNSGTSTEKETTEATESNTASTETEKESSTDTSEKKSGCGASVASTSILLLAALGAALPTFRKKKD